MLYTGGPMSSIALNLRNIEKLQKRPVSARRYREAASQLRFAAHYIECHWDEMDQEVRSKLASIDANFGFRTYFPSGAPTFRDYASLLSLPFSVANAWIKGEDFVMDYSAARAEFLVALHFRLRLDEDVAKKAWESITRTDPDFLAAHERGVASIAAQKFVEVDWTTGCRISH